MNVHQDQSFGVIPLMRSSDGWQVFLVQHRHSRHWGFPKGHAEMGELPQDAARRELKEETNLDVCQFLNQEPLIERYRFALDGQKIFKTVYYFMAEVSGTVSLQKKEIYDGKWLLLPQAQEQMTHAEGKGILHQVEKILAHL